MASRPAPDPIVGIAANLDRMGPAMKTIAALKETLRVAWNRKLYHWWREYNQEYLAGALKMPLIRLGDGRRLLGQWDASTRTLTISTVHIEHDPWLSVMETLRHEMAHQYVDEVLKTVGEAPHGPAFREACRRMRCNDCIHANHEEGSEAAANYTPDDKILRVLQKVLSLAESPNEHEAQAAVQKARYLLMKYNIDIAQLDQQREFSMRPLGEVKGRRTSCEIWLASILNRFFFVEIIWASTYDAHRDQIGSILQIFGTPQNLDMAQYVYGYLLNLLDRMWEAYKVANDLHFNRERQRYFAGVLAGFYGKLEEQEETLRKTHALVWKGDGQLLAYYRYMNPSVRMHYSTGVSRTEAYVDGVEDGRQVSIHKPIAETAKAFGGYLTDGGV